MIKLLFCGKRPLRAVTRQKAPLTRDAHYCSDGRGKRNAVAPREVVSAIAATRKDGIAGKKERTAIQRDAPRGVPRHRNHRKRFPTDRDGISATKENVGRCMRDLLTKEGAIAGNGRVKECLCILCRNSHGRSRKLSPLAKGKHVVEMPVCQEDKFCFSLLLSERLEDLIGGCAWVYDCGVIAADEQIAV